MLARDGARGLTYRAVEHEAGLPAGTTSNYFRSRDELLAQLGQRIFERLAPDDAFLADAATRAPTIDLLREYVLDIVRRVTADPALSIALLELRLEATRRPALSTLFTDTLRHNLEADVVFHEQAGLPGGRREVVLLHLAIDGLILELLTTPGALAIDDVDAVVATVVERLVGG